MQSEMSYKVILLGDCRVGKTSMLQGLIGRNMISHSIPPTIGVQYSSTTMRILGTTMKVNIWDTSGAEKYQSITSSYYRKCQGAIIVFDITNRTTFINLKKWFEEISKKTTHTLSVIIVGNKMDLVETGQKQRQVNEEEIIDFCVQHSITYKLTSAITGYNVRDCLVQLLESNHNHIIQKYIKAHKTDKFMNIQIHINLRHIQLILNSPLTLIIRVNHNNFQVVKNVGDSFFQDLYFFIIQFQQLLLVLYQLSQQLLI